MGAVSTGPGAAAGRSGWFVAAGSASVVIIASSACAGDGDEAAPIGSGVAASASGGLSRIGVAAAIASDTAVLSGCAGRGAAFSTDGAATGIAPALVNAAASWITEDERIITSYFPSQTFCCPSPANGATGHCT
jgi:hypothetical protein